MPFYDVLNKIKENKIVNVCTFFLRGAVCGTCEQTTKELQNNRTFHKAVQFTIKTRSVH